MSDLPTTSNASADRRHGADRDEPDSLLVVVQGPAAGGIFPLFRDETSIGRSKDANVFLDDASVSRRHAMVRRTAHSFVIADLGSRNGTSVNGHRGAHAVLKDQDRIEIGNSIVKFVANTSREQSYYQEAYRRANMDTVLLVYNKHYFLQRLDEELYRCRRDCRELSLVLFDADRFKRLNDTYGHLAGDAALLHLVSLVKSNTREGDALCRYGGEEFALLLPSTARSQAFVIGENIRSVIARTPLELGDQTIPVTVSVGVAGLDRDTAEQPDDGQSLIDAADRALYRAKQGGRNRTVAAEPSFPP